MDERPVPRPPGSGRATTRSRSGRPPPRPATGTCITTAVDLWPTSSLECTHFEISTRAWAGSAMRPTRLRLGAGPPPTPEAKRLRERAGALTSRPTTTVQMRQPTGCGGPLLELDGALLELNPAERASAARRPGCSHGTRAARARAKRVSGVRGWTLSRRRGRMPVGRAQIRWGTASTARPPACSVSVRTGGLPRRTHGRRSRGQPGSSRAGSRSTARPPIRSPLPRRCGSA